MTDTTEISVIDLSPGMVVSLFGRIYRIAMRYFQNVTLIEMNVDRYHFETANVQFLLSLGEEDFHVEKDTYDLPDKIFSEEESKTLQKKKQDLDELLLKFFPRYEDLASKKPKQEIGLFAMTHKISEKTVHRMILKYLQSGCVMQALIDKRTARQKNGRAYSEPGTMGNRRLKNGKIREILDADFEKMIFDEGYRLLEYKKARTVRGAFNLILARHFREAVYDDKGQVQKYILVPPEKQPSEGRFRLFVKSNTDNMSMDSYHKGERERRNSGRTKMGSSRSGCIYPGAMVEVDACEIDMMVVDKERLKVLGRAVVYVAVDVYSGAIVSWKVGFENNSFLGASNLMINLLFRKAPIIAEDGIEVVPAGFIPNAIRTDHGPEWVSKALRTFSRETGVRLAIVPPAMGSYKGLVEGSFKEYQKEFHDFGEQYGMISKAYDSKHYDRACLILEEVDKDMMSFVKYHNNRVNSEYEMTKDMISSGLVPTPANIFRYGLEREGCPATVTDAASKRVHFALCREWDIKKKLSVSLSGFCINDLYYFSTDPDITDIIRNHSDKNMKKLISVRYDPRSVNEIYVRYHNKYITVPLATKHDALLTYEGMTWTEYDMYYTEKKRILQEAETEAKNMEIDRISERVAIFEKAKKEQKASGITKPISKNIRQNRQAAKLDEQRKDAYGSLGFINEPNDTKMLPVETEIREEGPDNLEDWYD